jgi:hypothetical protein
VLGLNIMPRILCTYSSPLPCVPHSLPISSFLQVVLPNLCTYFSPPPCVLHSVPISLFLKLFLQKLRAIFPQSRMCYIPCQFHFFYLITRIISEEYVKSLGPSLCNFFKPLMTVRFSRMFFFLHCCHGPLLILITRYSFRDKLYLPLHRVWRLNGERWGARTGSDFQARETFSGPNGVFRPALSMSS